MIVTILYIREHRVVFRRFISRSDNKNLKQNQRSSRNAAMAFANREQMGGGHHHTSPQSTYPIHSYMMGTCWFNIHCMCTQVGGHMWLCILYKCVQSFFSVAVWVCKWRMLVISHIYSILAMVKVHERMRRDLRTTHPILYVLYYSKTL